MACPCRPLIATQLGLGRSWPVAFGRTKNISRARPAHRARDAAREPRGRPAVPTKMVFEAPAPQDWCPLVRTGASTDAVPPMEDIADDRSEVLAAAEVDRDGLQPLAHAASAAAKTTRTNRVFVTEWLYLC